MAPTFPQIQRSTNLTEEVEASIKEAIVSGDYQPGEALPKEGSIADQFGVSRVVVREALKGLKSKGFIELRRGPKGGPFVTQLDLLTIGGHLSDMIRLREVTIDQLFQVRFLVEPEIVRLALQTMTDEQIKELQDIVTKANRTKDDRLRKDLNVNFHRKLGEISGNKFYEILMNSFMDFVDGFIHVLIPEHQNIRKHEDHLDILRAIVARDEAKASAALMAHLINVRDAMIEKEQHYLKQAGRFSNGSQKMPADQNTNG